jgi:hypothetical protein
MINYFGVSVMGKSVRNKLWYSVQHILPTNAHKTYKLLKYIVHKMLPYHPDMSRCILQHHPNGVGGGYQLHSVLSLS